MITVSDIINTMEKWAPPSTMSEGDNVGLLVGRKDAPVQNVLIALEVDSAVIDEAIRCKADLIVCHHPIIYYPPLKSVTDQGYVSNWILRLIEHGIAVYAAHTNLDWAQGGVCDTLAKTVGIFNLQPMENNEGRCGEITPMPLKEFAQHVKDSLGCPAVKYVGEPDRIINKVGVVSGGGGDYMDSAAKMGCDLFLSADFKYHQAQKAQEIGLCLIDVGHFETENGIIYPIANLLKKEYNNISVFTSERKHSYFKYL